MVNSPGTNVATPFVFSTFRFVVGTIGSVSDAVLSGRCGSVTPAGGVTVTLLVKEPLAVGETSTATVKPFVAPTPSNPLRKLIVRVAGS